MPVNVSVVYTKKLQECNQIEEEKKIFMAGKSFGTLSHHEKLQFCKLNKRLMESHWACFECAKAEENNAIAIRHFAKAFDMGFYKANRLYNKKMSSNLQLENTSNSSIPPDEYYYTGLCYQIGLGVPHNRTEALRWYRRAEHRDAHAQAALGYAYDLALVGVKQDLKEAVRLYALAAEQGNASAQNNLGYAYKHGEGIPKNLELAMHWYNVAIEQGYPHAQYNLGNHYQYGDEDATQNLIEALSWYTLAAEQGNPYAQNKLGYVYQQGEGVTQNLIMAVSCYTLAADQGYSTAQWNLGTCYYLGIGVQKNQEQAVRLFKMAAEQGHIQALDLLKKIKTPLALYAVALVENNDVELINLVLTHDELQKALFEKDGITIISRKNDKEAVSTFFSTLLTTAHKQDKNINSSLINSLLALDKETKAGSIKRDDDHAELMSQLANLINLAEVNVNELKELMYFFCTIYIDGNSHTIAEHLILLWHRAQTLQVPMDDLSLNRLFASTLVSCCFKDRYHLKFTGTISQDDLTVLVFACMNKSSVALDVLNSLFTSPILMDSKENLTKLLCRLNACISNSAHWGDKIPPYMNQIADCISTSIDKNKSQNSIELFSQLVSDAKLLLEASNRLGFLAYKPISDEIKLARILREADTNDLLLWIVDIESMSKLFFNGPLESNVRH